MVTSLQVQGEMTVEEGQADWQEPARASRRSRYRSMLELLEEGKLISSHHY